MAPALFFEEDDDQENEQSQYLSGSAPRLFFSNISVTRKGFI